MSSKLRRDLSRREEPLRYSVTRRTGKILSTEKRLQTWSMWRAW